MFEVSVFDIKTASLLFKDNASSVVLPGEEGEITALDFHQSFIATLKKGSIRIDLLNIAVKSGIAGMKNNELSIFVESPEDK